jgi:Lrp/AsnC family transcriptional regulator
VLKVGLADFGWVIAEQARKHSDHLLEPVQEYVAARGKGSQTYRQIHDNVGSYPNHEGGFAMDERDRHILRELQSDSAQSLEDLATKVNLSRNACWRRVKSLEDRGVIRGRVALLDPARLNLGLTAFIAIRTSQHDQAWLDRFSAAVRDIPEIIGVYRTTGDTDYMLQAVVPDITGYDRLYKRLIARVPLNDVSSFFVMEKVKETTALPLDYAS